MARLTSTSTSTTGVATLALALILGGCAHDSTPAADGGLLADTTSQSASPTTGPPPTGSWIHYLSRDRTARLLQAAGLGKWSKKYFVTEDWPKEPKAVTAVYTFTPTKVEDANTWRGTFQAAYFEREGYWHVGWKGLLTVDGHSLKVTDDYGGSADRFVWRVRGDHLTLRWQGSDLKEYKGIPSRVYMVSEMTDPLKKTDCPMDPATNC